MQCLQELLQVFWNELRDSPEVDFAEAMALHSLPFAAPQQKEYHSGTDHLISQASWTVLVSCLVPKAL